MSPQPPLHLTYCLNVHPGEEWADNLAAIRIHTLAIRDRVAPGKPFGLGLRLSRRAAETLSQPDTLADFKAFMARNSLYAFTINGFPYGAFHGKPVKTEVYLPDWSTPERLDYTLLLAHILAQLLPDGIDGSISTVPLGYRAPDAEDGVPPNGNRRGVLADRLSFMIANLAECAAGLHKIRTATGKEIHLGLEPEPDCLLETTEGVIHFFEGTLLPHGVPLLAARLGCPHPEAEAILRRHIGVCFDTCHLAIQFEPLADSLTRLTRHGIRISKVQLSSALEVIPTRAARDRLSAFCDPVYLHQVKALTKPTPNPSKEGNKPNIAPLLGGAGGGCIYSYPDLDAALATPCAASADTDLWRIHFHVPLYFERDDVLHSTSKAMDATFWRHVATAPVSHLEIETYTFHILPQALRADGIEASIAKEYEWVRGRLAPHF